MEIPEGVRLRNLDSSRLASKFKKRQFLLTYKSFNVGTVVAQKDGNLVGCAVPEADPNDFRRSAAQDTKSMKVLVLSRSLNC